MFSRTTADYGADVVLDAPCHRTTPDLKFGIAIRRIGVGPDRFDASVLMLDRKLFELAGPFDSKQSAESAANIEIRDRLVRLFADP